MSTSKHTTIPGRSYVLRSTASASVSATRNDTTYTLASHSGQEGEVYFTAISSEVSVTTAGAYVIQELFNAAPLASAGAGGSSSVENAGIMPVEYVNWSNPILKAGVMYIAHAITDLDASRFSLLAEADECVTCELVVTADSGMNSSWVIWPESWEWINGTESNGSAPSIEASKNYYFAIRTVMDKTVINHYLTTDQA